MTTDLIGLEVYTVNGLRLGTVDDTYLDFQQGAIEGLALVELNHEAFKHIETGRKGVVIPYRWVRASHDIVLVMDIIDQLAFDSPE